MPIRKVSSFHSHAPYVVDQDEDYSSLKVKYDALKIRCEKAEEDSDRRRKSYAAREVDYKYRIQELEAENRMLLDERLSWTSTDKKFQRIRSLHQAVIHNIECARTSATESLQEQERDLLRAFRARLYDVETELEKERSKSGDTSVWVERSRMLGAEVARRKEVEIQLRTENEELHKEVRRLRGDIAGEEGNKEFIIKQLVLARKEVLRLREESGGTGSGDIAELESGADWTHKVRNQCHLVVWSGVSTGTSPAIR